MGKFQTTLTAARMNVSIEPTEPLTAEAELLWEFTGGRWRANSTVMQWYSRINSLGSDVGAVATLRLAEPKSLVEKSDPAIALAFRRPTRVGIEDLTASAGFVIVTLVYSIIFRDIQRFRDDIELDRRAIASWLESDPEFHPEILVDEFDAAT